MCYLVKFIFHVSGTTQELKKNFFPNNKTKNQYLWKFKYATNDMPSSPFFHS